MSTERDYIELFDRVIDQQLTTEELAEFERLITENQEVAEDFEAYKVARRALEIEGLKTDLAEIRNAKKRHVTIVKRLIPIGVAASILLGISLFNTRRDISPITLFEQHFEPYPYLFNSRNKPNNVTKPAGALDLYQQKRYEEASGLFPESITNDTLLFFKGINHLALTQPDSALHTFKLINSSSIFREEVLWYQGLGHLALDQPDSTTYYLEQISDTSKRRKFANSLLDEMGK